MGSVYRERFDDSRTSVSSARRDGGGYTTRTRYIVKEDDSRSSVGRDRRFVPERAGERVEETRIVRREVEEPAREVRREEPRYTERELVIRRERDDDTRSHYAYEPRREEPPTAERELVIRRTTEREEPRRDDAVSVVRYDDRSRANDVRVTETRYRDDYEILSPTRGIDDRDRDLQRYSRTSEYFSPPQPQTIVIRQEPIIIRERIRDDDYQIVRKSDIEDERTVVRREPPRGEEDFFYEKKVRERIDEPRRDEDDYYERRSRRRSVSPHDSVSQRGRDYSSDDSMVYVRKEVREDSRDASPDHRKNLAAGVVAGIGAAELLRNHKKKEGRETSHGIGRIGRDVGAGALGAIAAEGISRARSAHRSKSRRRHSRSRSRRRSRSRSRSRSSSRGHSKLKTLGAVGLGAAALAAAVTVASKRMGNKEAEEPPRRSRSRHRREDTLSELENDPTADDARNPKHRNKRIAEAGAAGAVVAGLIERARSKSRGRSQSRVRQALPVVAAGLGSAALAGLYEKNKAKKEAEVIQKEERRARSRSRSRARSDAYYDGPRDATVSDPGLIEYGHGPMHGNNYGPDYYGRPAPVDNYYGTSNAVVPAAAAGAAGYAAQRDARSRSRSASRERRSRRSSRSSSSSQDHGKHSRRRSRDAAKYAAAAAAGAIGASEYDRRKEEKRERKARRRREEEAAAYGGHDPYEDNYNPGPAYASTSDPYASQQGFYPQTSQFPPPPGSMPGPYNPQAAPVPPPGAAPYPPQTYPPPPPPTAPPPVNANYDAYASGANPYAPRGPENVSAVPNPAFGNSFTPATPNDQRHVPDGLTRDIPAPSPPPPPPPPPTINVQPPSTTIPPSFPAYVPTPAPPVAYPPPPPSPPPFAPFDERLNERTPSPPRSHSQPPPSSPRKSVQFSETPEVSTFTNSVPRELETSSPDNHNHRHRHSHSRGYEAGDDTDSTPDDARRRNQDHSSRSRDVDEAGDSSERRRHRRRRSHDPSSSRGEPSSRDAPLERITSPADSEATVDLPARFDEKGRKKAEAGDDPLADRFDEILAGKGTAGKMFGNFLDGFFGPEGRKKKGR